MSNQPVRDFALFNILICCSATVVATEMGGKRERTKFTEGQIQHLESVFAKCRYPQGSHREQLANDLCLTETKVQVCLLVKAFSVNLILRFCLLLLKISKRIRNIYNPNFNSKFRWDLLWMAFSISRSSHPTIILALKFLINAQVVFRSMIERPQIHNSCVL